jgi:prepilin-type N-terminal cleavage/methylation domain-containing protein
MNTKKGFTLIELLVVIAIIGILSSVVLASLNSARQKSRDARRVSDIKQMQLALELFFDSNQTYPATIGEIADGGFIATVPTGPSANETYPYLQLDSGMSYVLRANLEDDGHVALGSGVGGTFATPVGNCADAGAYCVQP